MTRTGYLDSKNHIIFDENDITDFEIDGELVRDYTLPENTAVVLSVGVGTHCSDTPYIIHIGTAWADVELCSQLAADILAFTHCDQVSIRFVEGKNWVENHPINKKLLHGLHGEIAENYNGS